MFTARPRGVNNGEDGRLVRSRGPRYAQAKDARSVREELRTMTLPFGQKKTLMGVSRTCG